MDEAFGFDFALNVTQDSKAGLRMVNSAVDKIARNVANAKDNFKNAFSSKGSVGQNTASTRPIQSTNPSAFSFAGGKDPGKLGQDQLKNSEDLLQNHNKIKESMKKENALNEDLLKSYEGITSTVDKYKGYLATVINAYLAYRAVDAFTSSTNKLDEMLTKNMKTFGNYQKTLEAYNSFQAKIAKGEFFGDPEEYMQAAEMFAVKGVQFNDQLQKTVNDLALYSGRGVTETASTIQSAMSGSFEELAALTGVTERTIRERFARYEGDNKRTTEAVLSFIEEQKRLQGAAMRAPKTFGDYLTQFKNFFSLNVFQSIFGTSNDPNSLVSKVKGTLDKVAGFLNKNAETVRKVSAFIGSILRFIWNQVDAFVGSILDYSQKALAVFQKWFGKFQDRVAGILLYLSITKGDIIGFFKAITFAYIAFKAAILTRNAFLMLGRFASASNKSINSTYQNLVKLGKWARGTKLFNLLSSGFSTLRTSAMASRFSITGLTTAFRGMSVAMMANPIGLIIAAIVALIAYVYLLIKHWDTIRQKVQGVSDTVLLLAAYMMPLIGIPLLLAKHWQKFKSIFINLWNIVKYNVLYIFDVAREKAMGFWDTLVNVFSNVKNFISNIASTATQFFKDMMPDWLVNFGSYIWDSIKSVGQRIKDFFIGLAPDWLLNAIDYVKDMDIGGMLSEMVDATADASENARSRYLKRKGVEPQLADETVKGTGRRITDETVGLTEREPEKQQKQRSIDAPMESPKKAPMNAPIDTPIQLAGASKTENTDNSQMRTEYNYNKGAIQINLPDNADVDAQEIAREVDKILSRKYKDRVNRAG